MSGPLLDIFVHNAGRRILGGIVGNLVEQGQSVQVMDFRGRLRSSKHPQVTVLVPQSRSHAKLKTQLNSADRSQYLVLNGVEALIDGFEGDAVSTRQFANANFRFFTEEQRSWASIMPFINEVRQILGETNLVLVLEVEPDEETEQAIVSLFADDDSAAVYTIKSEEDDAVTLQKAILTSIRSKSLDDTLSLIDGSERELPEFEAPRWRAYAHLQHGLRSDAIRHFEQANGHLPPHDRLLLAELYLSVDKPIPAFDLCQSVYDLAPMTPNTAKLILKSLLALPTDKAFDPWVDRALQLDTENPDVLDLAANCLNRVRRYGEAADLRRKLGCLTKDPSQELLARFIELQSPPQRDILKAEQYILEWASKHPQIRDEAHYRLGLLFAIRYRSKYKAFEHWNKVSTCVGSPFAYDAAKSRMGILEDNIVAERVLQLKSSVRERNATRLAERKTQELIRDMEILTTKPEGYTVWGNFIERSYTTQTWKGHLTKALFGMIRDWNTSLSDDPLSTSYLKRTSFKLDDDDELTPRVALAIVRRMKVLHLPSIKDDQDAYETMQGALVCVELGGDLEQRIWMRYEIAILCSLLGRDQDAINHALSLFELANQYVGEGHGRIARLLGLLAWGNAQYRLGHIVEGLASLIVGMQMGVEMGELGAVAEDGLNIVYRFLLDEFDRVPPTQNDKDAVTTFFGKLNDYLSPETSSVRIAFLTGDFGKAYALLRDDIYSDAVHDGEWAVNLSNFITACLHTDHVGEAFDLIVRYADEAVQLLLTRKDMLSQVLQSWSSVLVEYGIVESEQPVDAIRIARRLLRDAMELSDQRRRGLNFRGERARLADSHRGVALRFVEALALTHTTVDFTAEERESALGELVQALPRVTLRSILESRKHDVPLTQDAEELEREYRTLVPEILALEPSEKRQSLVERYNEVQAQLRQKHPNYKSLPRLSQYAIQDIQHVLLENEVLVQYVLTNLGMVTLVCNRDRYQAHFALVDSHRYRNDVHALGEYLQAVEPAKKGEAEQIRSLCAHLSAPIVEPLRCFLEVTGQGTTRLKLYVCPDLTLPMFSSNLLAESDGWLIQHVDSITNLIDFGQLLDRNEYENKGQEKVAIVATLGSEADSAVNKARAKFNSWARWQTVKHLDLKNNDEEVKALTEACRTLSPGTLIVVGHGIHDANVGKLNGATGILGHKHTIWGDDLSRLSGLTDYLILLTCSGGSPYQNEVESSTGVLHGTLSEDFFGVVLCRWDVDVRSSLELSEQVMSRLQEGTKVSLSAALGQAQRAILEVETWEHPRFWAGLEYWGY